MTIQRLDHVGIVVDDLAAATAFFVELGLTSAERRRTSIGSGRYWARTSDPQLVELVLSQLS
jgi:catechol 2,3-dioxygenase-like lactoylglutathione lyase family enzyme